METVGEGAVGPNEALAHALATARLAGRPAYDIAARARVSPSELSKFVNGHRVPDRTQAENIAAELGVTQIDKLFPRIRAGGDPIGGRRP